MGKLSVIMVNHNTGELAVDSLRKIRFSMDGIPGKIFFVDNGSEDGSVEAVAEVIARSVATRQSNLPEINIIANNGNSGFARAVNQGILKSDGDYILLINPDVTIYNNALSQLINFMETFPDAGVVTPYITYPDGRQQDFCSYFPTLTRQFFQLTGLRILFPSWLKRHFTISSGDKGQPFEVDWVIGACVIIRRNALEDAGGFDEDFFMYGEDLDFCYRLRKNGWRVYVIPDTRIFHIGSPKDILRSGILKEPLIHYTTYLFFKKHYGLISALILAGIQKTVSLARLAFWGVVFLIFPDIRDKAKMKLRIHYSCLRGLHG